jgi:hypothetical protein
MHADVHEFVHQDNFPGGARFETRMVINNSAQRSFRPKYWRVKLMSEWRFLKMLNRYCLPRGNCTHLSAKAQFAHALGSKL